MIEELRKKKFEFSKIGEFDMGLGLQFDTTEASMFISQPSSVEFIKNEFQARHNPCSLASFCADPCMNEEQRNLLQKNGRRIMGVLL